MGENKKSKSKLELKINSVILKYFDRAKSKNDLADLERDLIKCVFNIQDLINVIKSTREKYLKKEG